MEEKQPTPEENKLAEELRARGVKLTQQKPFSYTNARGRVCYIHPDICIEELRRVIEVDGSHHNGTAEQLRIDRLREKTIRAHGYELQRVGNKLVNDPEQLRIYADQVAGEYIERTPPTTPRVIYPAYTEVPGKKKKKLSWQVPGKKSPSGTNTEFGVSPPTLLESFAMDLIGMATYLLPVFGEILDIVWAVFVRRWLMHHYGHSGWGTFAFIEEIIPFTDFIPSATIAYIFAKRKSSSEKMKRYR